jgi:hypothetical protein
VTALELQRDQPKAELQDPFNGESSRDVPDPRVVGKTLSNRSGADSVGANSSKDSWSKLGNTLSGDPSVRPEKHLGAIA